MRAADAADFLPGPVVAVALIESGSVTAPDCGARRPPNEMLVVARVHCRMRPGPGAEFVAMGSGFVSVAKRLHALVQKTPKIVVEDVVIYRWMRFLAHHAGFVFQAAGRAPATKASFA